MAEDYNVLDDGIEELIKVLKNPLPTFKDIDKEIYLPELDVKPDDYQIVVPNILRSQYNLFSSFARQNITLLSAINNTQNKLLDVVSSFSKLSAEYYYSALNNLTSSNEEDYSNEPQEQEEGNYFKEVFSDYMRYQAPEKFLGFIEKLTAGLKDTKEFYEPFQDTLRWFKGKFLNTYDEDKLDSDDNDKKLVNESIIFKIPSYLNMIYAQLSLLTAPKNMNSGEYNDYIKKVKGRGLIFDSKDKTLNPVQFSRNSFNNATNEDYNSLNEMLDAHFDSEFKKSIFSFRSDGRKLTEEDRNLLKQEAVSYAIKNNVLLDSNLIRGKDFKEHLEELAEEETDPKKKESIERILNNLNKINLGNGDDFKEINDQIKKIYNTYRTNGISDDIFNKHLKESIGVQTPNVGDKYYREDGSKTTDGEIGKESDSVKELTDYQIYEKGVGVIADITHRHRHLLHRSSSVDGVQVSYQLPNPITGLTKTITATRMFDMPVNGHGGSSLGGGLMGMLGGLFNLGGGIAGNIGKIGMGLGIGAAIWGIYKLIRGVTDFLGITKPDDDDKKDNDKDKDKNDGWTLGDYLKYGGIAVGGGAVALGALGVKGVGKGLLGGLKLGAKGIRQLYRGGKGIKALKNGRGLSGFMKEFLPSESRLAAKKRMRKQAIKNAGKTAVKATGKAAWSGAKLGGKLLKTGLKAGGKWAGRGAMLAAGPVGWALLGADLLDSTWAMGKGLYKSLKNNPDASWSDHLMNALDEESYTDKLINAGIDKTKNAYHSMMDWWNGDNKDKTAKNDEDKPHMIYDNGKPYDFKNINPELKKKFQVFSDNYFAKTGQPLIVTSGNRDTEKQKKLWEQTYGTPYTGNEDADKAAAHWDGKVAYPGKSHHEQGNAIDIDLSKTIYNKIAKNGDLNPTEFDKDLEKAGLYRPYAKFNGSNVNERWHIEALKDKQDKLAYENLNENQKISLERFSKADMPPIKVDGLDKSHDIMNKQLNIHQEHLGVSKDINSDIKTLNKTLEENNSLLKTYIELTKDKDIKLAKNEKIKNNNIKKDNHYVMSEPPVKFGRDNVHHL